MKKIKAESLTALYTHTYNLKKKRGVINDTSF